MLKGKSVLLGITGGIAAYKAAYLASALVKQHAHVQVIMTQSATQFIAPLTFEQLTGNKCLTDTFDRNFVHQVEHIAVADRTDLVIIAPATANVCAKLAHGIADDMLTTTVLACRCPKLIAPAMNTNMYENQVTQDNLELLRKYGWQVIDPASGRLACGAVGAGKLPEPEFLLEHILHAIALPHDLAGKKVLVTAGPTQESLDPVRYLTNHSTGKGKMPEPEDLMQHILRHLAMPHDLAGKKVLVTAGPTQEALDPVRYLTNHSTGKMGYAIARMAMLRGADVTLVSGPTNIAPPPFVKVINIKSAQDMFEAVSANAPDMDFIFKAAAVADYTPATYADNKMKKKDGDLSIPLKRTQDILKHLGEHRIPGQVICGFSMETENMLENSRAKLAKKNVDMICANNLKQSGAGFGVDTNIITLITKDDVTELPLLSKEEAANAILNKAMTLAK